MKTKYFINKIPMIKKGIVPALLGIIICLLPSCLKNDDVGDNYVTFTGEMMGEYLKNRKVAP